MWEMNQSWEFATDKLRWDHSSERQLSSNVLDTVMRRTEDGMFWKVWLIHIQVEGGDKQPTLTPLELNLFCAY